MRLLFAGDLHIGRSSSRIPSRVSTDVLRAAAGWERIVDLAIAENVGLLCLSGDVADRENKFWEAIGPLEAGVQRLAESGIEVVAVAGNHDYDVLARLADRLDSGNFRLLGRGGSWERYTVRRDGNPILHIDGWSFPSERVYRSPLPDYDFEVDAATPALGLLHGDLGVPDSAYAPIDVVRLRSLPPQGWVLGHVHAPSLAQEGGAPWVLYPGSPQALDFGEPGVHGAWIAEVTDRLSVPEQRALSTVCYAHVEIDLSDAENEESVETAVLQQLRSAARGIVETGSPHVECVSVRLNVIGRTPVSHRVRELTEAVVEDLALTVGDAAVSVDRINVATLPDIDINQYAKANSAPGAVARLLLALEQPDPPQHIGELISRTRLELEQVEDHKYFAALEHREITNELAREYLRDTSTSLLTQLVSQAS